LGLAPFFSERWFLRSPAALLAWQVLVFVVPFMTTLVLFIGIMIGAGLEFIIGLWAMFMSAWGAIGLVAAAFDRKRTADLAALKEVGERFDCEIVELVHYRAIRIGLNDKPAVYLRCRYVDKAGIVRKVDSRVFIWRGYDSKGLRAVAWVEGERVLVEVAESD